MLDLGDADNTRRLVVVATHPGDAVLGAGGLVATAHDLGLQVYGVLLTAGRHTAGRGDPPEPAEAAARVAAAERAFGLLAPGAHVAFLGATAGAVRRCEREVARGLTVLVGHDPRTLLLAPWRFDGEADHDATGRAAAVAASATGARLLEYPLRSWRNRSQPWPRLSRLDLSPEAQHRKQLAAAAAPDRGGCAPPPSRTSAPVEHYLAEPGVSCDAAREAR